MRRCVSAFLAFVLALACGERAQAQQCDVFRDCGTIVQGLNCTFFSAQSGGLYLLDDFGGFQVNDVVYVEGFLESCVSVCLQGNGCIRENTIGPCTLPGPPTDACAGDGFDPSVTTACPCGNFGGVGRGCANSVNPAGASLTLFGKIVQDDVVLVASGMPASAGVIFLKGSAHVPTAVAFGDGIRCADGALVRLRFKTASAGCAHFPEPGDPTLSSRGGTPIGSGLLASYVAYYRNAAAFCTPDTFNATNGHVLVW